MKNVVENSLKFAGRCDFIRFWSILHNVSAKWVLSLFATVEYYSIINGMLKPVVVEDLL